MAIMRPWPRSSLAAYCDQPPGAAQEARFEKPLAPPPKPIPEPAAGPTPPDRKAGMEAYLTAVSPEEYPKRKGLD